jgi:hypothetical protein
MITDTAKSIAAAINMAVAHYTPEEVRRSFMAFRLLDGGTDHVLYPSKTDAISHVSNEFQYCFFHLAQCMGGISERDAQLWMDFQRHAHKQGIPLTNPDDLLMFPLARGGGYFPR